jgi:hypothetical protein
MKFKRRHGEFEQGCVLSESYTATDALPPILPACRQPLLPACVFVTRDTVLNLRHFLFGKFVREPICSWREAFVNRGSTVLNNNHKLHFQLIAYYLIPHVFYHTLITSISTLIYVALTSYIVMPYAHSVIWYLVTFCKNTTVYNPNWGFSVLFPQF